MTNFKDTTGDVSETLMLEWANFINQFMYGELININPEDYISNSIIYTISSTQTYSLPSDYQGSKVNGAGLYRTSAGTTYTALNYDAEVGAFTVGDTLTGGTSGATGTIAYITDYGTTGTLTLTGVTGTFEDNENITDATTGDATANGSPKNFVFYFNELPVTGFGRPDKGYYINASNIVMTPVPTTGEVFTFRYIPTLDYLTAETDSTIIPDRFREFIRNATDVFWEQWREKQDMEILASQRFQSSLLDLFAKIKKTANVMSLTNRNRQYSNSTRIIQN